ncbi:unnamed protein product [Dovyalis caffra]|uniref:BHLH domain-containing protein n=1 Tax=Dovyalis caffra TaxID=77055 RepID=A0AAV1S597_9ROSI|nr:unnamed protein product [Dovyalis caffra]
MQPTPAGSSNTTGGGGGGRGGGGGGVGGGGGGGGGGLARFRSAPASWLEALLEEEEEDPLKQNQNLTQLLTSSTPSSRNSVPFNASSASVEPGLFEPGGGFQRQNSSPADFIGNSGIGSDQGYFPSYGIASNYEYMPPNMEVSPSGKRAREVELQNPSVRYPPTLKGEQTGPLRASSLIEMEMDKLLEDSVPCRVRAKRGCATHPRSIAERVRRTRISDRIRKLQELVPNMDKHIACKSDVDIMLHRNEVSWYMMVVLYVFGIRMMQRLCSIKCLVKVDGYEKAGKGHLQALCLRKLLRELMLSFS